MLLLKYALSVAALVSAATFATANIAANDANLFPQLCDEYKAVGLDFKILTAPCTCLQITSLDTTNHRALFRVDVLCENMRLNNLQKAFEAASKLPFSAALGLRLSGATHLTVFYNIELKHVGADGVSGESTWPYFVNNIDMRKFALYPNTTAAVDAITFDACTELLVNGSSSSANSLLFSSLTFSPLRKISFVNIPDGMVVSSIGIDTPLPDMIDYRPTLKEISDRALDKLGNATDALLLTIVNAQLGAIPLSALSVFSNVSSFNMSNNRVLSVALPTQVKSMGVIGNTIDLSNNMISNVNRDAFWNHMAAATNHTKNLAGHLNSISLRNNQIDAVDAGAFDFLADNTTTADVKNFFIDLSSNKLHTIPMALVHLPASVDFDLSSNQISRVNSTDLYMATWNKLAPIRLAHNPLDCSNLDNVAWLACWAQHTVGNLSINIDYLRCHVGGSLNTTTELVKYYFIPNGKCLALFPADGMFIWHDDKKGGGGGMRAWEILMLLFVLTAIVVGIFGGAFMFYTKRWTMNRFRRFENENVNAPTYGGIA